MANSCILQGLHAAHSKIHFPNFCILQGTKLSLYKRRNSNFFLSTFKNQIHATFGFCKVDCSLFKSAFKSPLPKGLQSARNQTQNQDQKLTKSQGLHKNSKAYKIRNLPQNHDQGLAKSKTCTKLGPQQTKPHGIHQKTTQGLTKSRTFHKIRTKGLQNRKLAQNQDRGRAFV